jgi:uncharacterized protein YndB with AHSA1/START domain
MRKFGLRTLALAAVLMMALPFCQAADEPAVKVVVRGETVVVDVEMTLTASPCEVWAVLIDFEHLPRFVANITESRVLAREGNSARVFQRGKTSFGPLSFQFESERELRLTPCERMDSRLLKGNLKAYRGTTELEQIQDGTRLRHHSESVPESILPPVLGRSLIEAETREHYLDLRREVQRRVFCKATN